jgi:hypothetical protein
VRKRSGYKVMSDEAYDKMEKAQEIARSAPEKKGSNAMLDAIRAQKSHQDFNIKHNRAENLGELFDKMAEKGQSRNRVLSEGETIAEKMKEIDEAKRLREQIEKGADNIIDKVDDVAPKKFGKLSKIIGGRALKALPIVGTIAGLASAGERAYAGDMDAARDELASAADPSGLTDVALIAKDVAEERLFEKEKEGMKQAEIDSEKKYSTSPASLHKMGMDVPAPAPAVKAPASKDYENSQVYKDARKPIGEIESPDLEEMDDSLDYQDYRKKLRR